MRRGYSDVFPAVRLDFTTSLGKTLSAQPVQGCGVLAYLGIVSPLTGPSLGKRGRTENHACESKALKRTRTIRDQKRAQRTAPREQNRRRHHDGIR